MVKEKKKKKPTNAGDAGLIPGTGRSPGGRNGNPLQYSCLGNPIDRGALAGYSPWGRKESDNTEPLTLSFCIALHSYNFHPFSSLLNRTFRKSRKA